jgi:hypothetical protein
LPTTTKRRVRRKPVEVEQASAELTMLAPADDAVAQEASPTEDLTEALVNRVGEQQYSSCRDLDDANERLRKRAGAIRDHWIAIAHVLNDVADHELFRPRFERLNDWMDSAECVLNHSQAHTCRRALRLHSSLLGAAKEPLPSLTHYRVATEGAEEEEWVARAEAIRNLSTRDAEEHLKAKKGEEELALAALVRVLKDCDRIKPKAALTGLAASDDRVALTANLERGATVLLNLYKAAKEAS